MGLKWVAKALMQKGISYFPNSEQLNYIFQTKVTKKLPTSRILLVEKAQIAINHFNSFKRYYNYTDVSDLKFFEFGAGWNMCVPLTYYMLGIDHQTVCDIEAHTRFNLINDSTNKIEDSLEEIQAAAGFPLRNLDRRPITQFSEMLARYGIDYKAPLDARNTGLPEGFFDFISNTLVLQSIPKNDIISILKECHRILKPAGIISCFVDLNDNYCYTDTSISRYNFLKFSDQEWKKYNSPVHYQNRLRYPDYMEMFAETGFKVLEQKINRPSAKLLETLSTIKLNEKFKKYSQEDLGVTSFWVTLGK